MRALFRATSLALVAVLILTACNKDPSTTGADAKRAMGLYAKGFNALLEDPKRLVAGYFSSITAGPKGIDLTQQPHLSDSTFAQRKVKEAREAFTAANEAAPDSLALAPKAEAAVAAAEQAVTTYDTAYKYYQAESYKDDKGAQAKQLHEQMIAASKTYDAALDALSAAMESIEDAQSKDEINKYAGDKNYSYWFRFYTHEAKRFVTAVTRAKSPADLQQLSAAAQTLATHDAALAAFAAKKGKRLNDSFKNYVDTATSFQAEVKKLLRLTEAGKTFEDDETAQAADAVIDTFNRLIRIGNTLYQIEGVDNLKDQ